MTSSAPFTENLRSDILLLSAWLDGLQPATGNFTRPHPKDNKALNFLTHVSNILTIGRRKQLGAENVNAVMASMESECIKCLIFSENCRPSVNVQKSTLSVTKDFLGAVHAKARSAVVEHLRFNYETGTSQHDEAQSAEVLHLGSQIDTTSSERRSRVLREDLEKVQKEAQLLTEPSVFEPYEVKPNRAEGFKLLQWEDWKDKDPNDFNFRDHLEDTFAVIEYIRSRQNYRDEPLHLRWVWFIHRRAFRKLGHRVKIFHTRWGKSPFAIMSENVKAISSDHSLPKDLQLQYVPHLDALLKNLRVQPTQKSGSKVTYPVDQVTLPTWLRMCSEFWQDLVNAMLVSKDSGWNIKTDSPNHSVVVEVVQCMKTFMTLKPLLEHLFSLPSLSIIFLDAERHVNLARGSDRTFNPFHRPASFNFTFPLVPEHETPDHESNDTPASMLRLSAEQLEELEELDELRPEQDDRPGDLVLRSLSTVLAWYRSANRLFYDRKLYPYRPLQLTRIQCKPFRAYSYNVQELTSESLPNIFPEVQWQEEAVNELVQRTWRAKVHAEAALMASTYISGNANEETPIGVGRKCCRLCWQMKEYLNSAHSTKFTLPGTHGTFYPWIPPPGIPEDVLVKIRNNLITVIRRHIETQAPTSHSRQSSDAGSETEEETEQAGGIGPHPAYGRLLSQFATPLNALASGSNP